VLRVPGGPGPVSTLLCERARPQDEGGPVSYSSVVFSVMPMLLALVPPQGPTPQVDPCTCAVVNRVNGIGDCKCDLIGQGRVDAFSYSQPVVPEGLAENGVCNATSCTGNNRCTFKPIRTTFTITACARKCTGHDDADTGLEWKRTGVAEMGSVDTAGKLDFGSSTTITSGAPYAAHSQCGSGPFEETITFKRKDLQDAYKLVFTFGCGKCRG
jgi:hypothetical protein